MSLHGPYETDNIFAKIMAGQIPCTKVYEDDVALSFMDLFPQSAGHTLVIPKDVQARNFLDMPTEKLGTYMERVQKVARAVETALTPDGIVVTQYNGAPAGQSVFHLHFHIIPKYSGTGIAEHAHGKQADIADLEMIAGRIRSAL